MTRKNRKPKKKEFQRRKEQKFDIDKLRKELITSDSDKNKKDRN